MRVFFLCWMSTCAMKMITHKHTIDTIYTYNKTGYMKWQFTRQ
jgi:hypothetical protein